MSRKKEFEKGAKDYFGPQYDSDEDLPREDRIKIKEKEDRFRYIEADKMREAAWEKADLYPKIKRFVKDAWSGDKHKPKK